MRGRVFRVDRDHLSVEILGLGPGGDRAQYGQVEQRRLELRIDRKCAPVPLLGGVVPSRLLVNQPEVVVGVLVLRVVRQDLVVVVDGFLRLTLVLGQETGAERSRGLLGVTLRGTSATARDPRAPCQCDDPEKDPGAPGKAVTARVG